MVSKRFDYFYGGEAEQYSFFRIPKVLITDDYFKTLSTDAKLLYGLMLDRMSLSLRNGWLDDEHRVYIYFTIEDVIDQLNCKNDKAIKLMAELDSVKGIGLIERIKQGQGRPAKIYVKQFIMRGDFKRSEKPMSKSRGIRSQEVGKSDVLTSEKPMTRYRQFESQEVGKTVANNTERNKTELNELNRSINPLSLIDVDGYREHIFENVEYGILSVHYNKNQLDEIIELLVETLCKKTAIITIGSEDFPSSLVKSRLLKLNRFHIEYVIDCMSKSTTQVRNIKQYMLKTLFNAPITMDHYYQAAVNHDFYDRRE